MCLFALPTLSSSVLIRSAGCLILGPRSLTLDSDFASPASLYTFSLTGSQAVSSARSTTSDDKVIWLRVHVVDAWVHLIAFGLRFVLLPFSSNGC
ncbi:hypothetical protein BO78DRAFT_419260 [Aspergillus sclerotiicarbonarius CBS 121057]|uniref:Uncharacterized protein n=1 Tax=Aspergillus sclerotiicarbonarius (strain CBS 121057 / IBT 28362) TaxID=1448318 RepID=A0A319EQL3_ASPSB|nr:hypothetical protein BO78DRAFT_419260 [Aspergillus sclerotiicarbonarius CBS 121057]